MLFSADGVYLDRSGGSCVGLAQKEHYKQIWRLEVIDAIPKSAAGKILCRVLRDSAAGGG